MAQFAEIARVVEIAETKFEHGLPAKESCLGIVDADALIPPELNRGPGGLAEGALKNEAPGVVDIASHEIEAAGGSRDGQVVLEVKELQLGQMVSDLKLDWCHGQGRWMLVCP
jgi:hypothetical protein